MHVCPVCHEDPGDESRCQNCGAIQYRYATDQPDATPGGTPEPEPPAPVPPPELGDPFPSPPPPVAPPSGGPRLNVPPAPPAGTWTPPPATGGPAYAPKTAKKGGGSGCAIAAVIAGAIILAAIVALLVVGRAVFEDGETRFSVDNIDISSSSGGEIDWAQARVGDCLNFLDPETVGDDRVVGSLELVDCTDPHDGELYALAPLGATTWPGADSAFSEGDEICFEAFAPYVGIDYIDSAYFYEVFTPTEDSWAAGDRNVACTLFDTEGPLSKPLRGSGE